MDSNLVDSIKRHEGYRNKAYQDTEGVWTIGYGTNLQELVIDEQLADTWLHRSIIDAASAARRFPEWSELRGAARQDAFIEMVYNMGPKRVAGFTNTLRAIRDNNWNEAAKEMLDSKWARQVGRRAERLAEQMRTGAYWNVD